MLRSLMKTARP